MHKYITTTGEYVLIIAQMSFKTVKSQLKIMSKSKRAENEANQNNNQQQQEHNNTDSNATNSTTGENSVNDGQSNNHVVKSGWEAATPNPQSPARQRPEELDPNIFVRINPAPAPTPEVVVQPQPVPEFKADPVPAPENSNTNTKPVETTNSKHGAGSMYNTPVEPKHGARGIKFSFS
jgi:hypothetical protein